MFGGAEVIIQDAADTVFSLNRWPYFDFSHFILICLAIRDDNPVRGHKDADTGVHLFSRNHPIANYLSCLLSGVAGALIVNLICGLPVAAPLANNGSVLMATLVWYLVFYSPWDVAYRLLKLRPVFLAVQLVKEVHRVMLIHGGVERALSTYPSGYVIAVLCGIITGAGSGVFRIFDRLIRGIWIPDVHEAIKPGFFTRASGIVSMIFIIKKCSSLIPPQITYPILYLAAVVGFIYFRLVAALLHVTDPLKPFEKIWSNVLFGAPHQMSVTTGESEKNEKFKPKIKTAAKKED